MPLTVVDGIATRYEVIGDGPPLLMLSPGGFAADHGQWTRHQIYRRLGLVDRLAAHFTCILFDKREAGESGGRVEEIGWEQYANQGLGLLDHLGFDRAHVMGGCVGCSIACRLSVDAPGPVSSLVLLSPAGGPRYRMTQRSRFGQHVTFVRARGLATVVALARETEATFSDDPRVGPWASVLRSDEMFARRFATLDVRLYLEHVDATCRTLFDRDTVPGCQPEELMTLDVPALVVPGADASHAPSAAQYLAECLPRVELADAPLAEQPADFASQRILPFLRNGSATER